MRRFRCAGRASVCGRTHSARFPLACTPPGVLYHLNMEINHTSRGSIMTFMIIDKRGRSTLPEEVRRDLGIGQEDWMLVILEKTAHGTYELVPTALIPKDQLWFHHPEMKRRVEQAEADFREGRYTSAATPQEAQTVLDTLKEN